MARSTQEKRKAGDEEAVPPASKKKKKKKQQAPSKKIPIDGDPGAHDVLFGKGSPFIQHNKDSPWVALVEFAAPIYKQLTRVNNKAKRHLAEIIISRVRELHPAGRFLYAEGNSYFEVDEQEKIIEKTMTKLLSCECVVQEKEIVVGEGFRMSVEEQNEMMRPFDILVRERRIVSIPGTADLQADNALLRAQHIIREKKMTEIEHHLSSLKWQLGTLQQFVYGADRQNRVTADHLAVIQKQLEHSRVSQQCQTMEIAELKKAVGAEQQNECLDICCDLQQR